MSPANPLEIVIEAVQFTAGRDPVLIQYSAKGATTGPFARTQLHHTTQSALTDRAPAEIRAIEADYWSDAEVVAELVEHLARFGVTATIVANEPPPQPDVPFTPPGVTMPEAELADHTMSETSESGDAE